MLFCLLLAGPRKNKENKVTTKKKNPSGLVKYDKPNTNPFKANKVKDIEEPRIFIVKYKEDKIKKMNKDSDITRDEAITKKPLEARRNVARMATLDVL